YRPLSALLIVSVPPEHEGLKGKYQSLKPQDYRMDQREGVDSVESSCPYPAGIICDNLLMVTGICVGNAAAAGSYTVEASFVERLERCEECARPRHLLRVDQLLAASVLAGGDVVLNISDHHGDDRERLGHASDFGRHSDLHDLRLDLP